MLEYKYPNVNIVKLIYFTVLLRVIQPAILFYEKDGTSQVLIKRYQFKMTLTSVVKAKHILFNNYQHLIVILIIIITTNLITMMIVVKVIIIMIILMIIIIIIITIITLITIIVNIFLTKVNDIYNQSWWLSYNDDDHNIENQYYHHKVLITLTILIKILIITKATKREKLWKSYQIRWRKQIKERRRRRRKKKGETSITVNFLLGKTNQIVNKGGHQIISVSHKRLCMLFVLTLSNQETSVSYLKFLGSVTLICALTSSKSQDYVHFLLESNYHTIAFWNQLPPTFRHLHLINPKHVACWGCSVGYYSHQ